MEETENENEELVNALNRIAGSLNTIRPILIGVQNSIQDLDKTIKQKKKCFVVRLFNTLKAKFTKA